MPPDDNLDALRTELRRRWRAAAPGRWEAPMSPTQRTFLVAVGADGGHRTLATFERAADAELAAAIRAAVPVLFAELDRLRAASRGVPVLGEVR